jgi:hypothetical protein
VVEIKTRGKIPDSFEKDFTLLEKSAKNNKIMQ